MNRIVKGRSNLKTQALASLAGAHLCIEELVNSDKQVTNNQKENEMTSNPKVAVVTATSSGIGREISLTLARNGFLTYATMRNLNKKGEYKISCR
jgi:K+-transporting ATPase c subunit